MATTELKFWIADVAVPLSVLTVIIITLFLLPVEKIKIALPVFIERGIKFTRSLALRSQNDSYEKNI